MSDNKSARNIGPDLEGYGANGGGPPYQPVYVVGSPTNVPMVRPDGSMLPAVQYTAVPNAGNDENQAPPPNYVKLAMQALRGRIILASVLSIVCAVLAAGVAWKFGKPQYSSESLLRIAYQLPVVMQRTEHNEPMLMFEAFMASQRTLITSRRVVELAIQDPIWKASGRPIPEVPEKYFADHLTVDIQFRSEFIRIIVTDDEPGTPAAAVTAITNAYFRLYNEQDKTMERSRTGLLTDRQANLQRQINDIQDELQLAAREYGTTNLLMWYEDQASQVARYDAHLNSIRFALATAPAAATQPTAPAAAPTPEPQDNVANALDDDKLIERITAFDPQMRSVVEEAEKLKEAIDTQTSRGLGEKHPQVVELKEALARATKRIQKQLKFQLDFRRATGRFFEDSGGGGGQNNAAIAGKSARDLKADEAQLTAIRDEAKKQMVDLGLKQIRLRKLETELAEARLELDTLTKRIETLRTESAIGGRLNIITNGEISLAPSRDPRQKYALAAAGMGGILPVAGIIALGLLGGRYRYSTDTETEIMPEIPFLGILPELGTKDLDGDRSVAAAHSIHQIRVAIQSRETEAEPRAYLVTSATASEGKTGLSMALGLSFAAAQQRTLVIDFDLVGRSLTSRLDVKDESGVREALEGGTIRSLVREVGGGLWVLPAGRGSAADAYAISAPKVRRLLAEARQDYDVVIVDTGPILGSIEAAVLAREVDGVVLTVARGRTRGMVRNAVRRLVSLGARPLGYVFNRAAVTDFEASPYSSSSVTSIASTVGRRTAADGTAIITPAGERATRLTEFGPLVQAVATRIPHDEN